MQRCTLDDKRICDNSCIAYDAGMRGCRLQPTSFRHVGNKKEDDLLDIATI